MITAEMASEQAKHLTHALKNAGRPVPSPINMPTPGESITQEAIVKVANRGQHGREYFSKPGRRVIFHQILGLDIPNKGTLKLQNISDIWLCRLWMKAHAADFAKKAFGRHFDGPVRLIKRF